MKKVTAFQSSDGGFFLSAKDCAEHEAKEEAKKSLNELHFTRQYMGSGERKREPLTRDVVNAIMENIEEITEICTKYQEKKKEGDNQ